MALWSAKNLGILFGGVTDEDTSEETMDSVFHNDLYALHSLYVGSLIDILIGTVIKSREMDVGSPWL